MREITEIVSYNIKVSLEVWTLFFVNGAIIYLIYIAYRVRHNFNRYRESGGDMKYLQRLLIYGCMIPSFAFRLAYFWNIYDNVRNNQIGEDAESNFYDGMQDISFIAIMCLLSYIWKASYYRMNNVDLAIRREKLSYYTAFFIALICSLCISYIVVLEFCDLDKTSDIIYRTMLLVGDFIGISICSYSGLQMYQKINELLSTIETAKKTSFKFHIALLTALGLCIFRFIIAVIDFIFAVAESTEDGLWDALFDISGSFPFLTIYLFLYYSIEYATYAIFLYVSRCTEKSNQTQISLESSLMSSNSSNRKELELPKLTDFGQRKIIDNDDGDSEDRQKRMRNKIGILAIHYDNEPSASYNMSIESYKSYLSRDLNPNSSISTNNT